MEVGTKIPDDPVMGMREKIGAMSERVDRMRLACTYLLEERRDDQKHLGKEGRREDISRQLTHQQVSS